jgi:hypothetical protein
VKLDLRATATIAEQNYADSPMLIEQKTQKK